MVRDEEGTKRQREDDLEERQKSRTLCAEKSVKSNHSRNMISGLVFFMEKFVTI